MNGWFKNLVTKGELCKILEKRRGENSIMKCDKCGNKILENDKIVWKCNSCGKQYDVRLSHLKRVQEKKNFDNIVSLLKCKECGNPLDDGNEKILWKCGSCGNIFPGNLRDFAALGLSNIENGTKEKIDSKRNVNVKNHYYNSEYTLLNRNACWWRCIQLYN